MTFEEIQKSDELMLTPAEVAEALHLDPNSLRAQAQHKPELLGFPVIVVGSRVKIPRVPFLKFLAGEMPVLRCSGRNGETILIPAKGGKAG